MGLHHATLKAAVALYAILLTQGKAEAEIKEAISKDEKKFSPEEVDEIYNEIVKQSNTGTESGSDGKDNSIQITGELKDEKGIDEIIASNNAVIESNNKVIKAIESFVATAGSLVQSISGQTVVQNQLHKDRSIEDFDPDADFVVSEGKSFRHPDSFDIIISEGSKVEGLSEEKLLNLYRQGIIDVDK